MIKDIVKTSKILVFTLLLSLVFNHLSLIYASDYVLPYPSYMPGNKLYAVAKIADRLESWWYWGAIGQTKYHMKLADKYLVEAKTLFEYKQYVLAINALRASDAHIARIPTYIALGNSQGKNMTEVELSFTAEKAVHREVLQKLKTELPRMFVWTPEKEAAATLDIDGLLSRAIILRGER